MNPPEKCAKCRQELEEYDGGIYLCIYCFAKYLERRSLRDALRRMKTALESKGDRRD